MFNNNFVDFDCFKFNFFKFIYGFGEYVSITILVKYLCFVVIMWYLVRFTI